MRIFLLRTGQGAVFGASLVVSASVTWTMVQSWRERNVDQWQVRRLTS